MEETNWLNILGWSEDDLSDLRFVGYSYIKQGHFDIALKIFEALVTISKTSAYDKQTLGAIYLEINDNLKALKMIDEALEIDPTHGLTLLNRAKALFLNGYTQQGISLCKNLERNNKDETIVNDCSALIAAYS